MVFIEPPWGSEFRVVNHPRLIYYAGTVEGVFKVDILTPEGDRVANEVRVLNTLHTVSSHREPTKIVVLSVLAHGG